MRGIGGVDAHVLVLMGPTGAGKSLLASWLDQRGAHVIDADRVGHEQLEEDSVQRALVERFGPGISRDGAIDRRALGRLVFAEDSALADLERIVHPRIRAEIERRVERLRRSRAVEWIVIDAALHFRFDPPIACDWVLGVSASASSRKMRIMQRDRLSEAEAEARLSRQDDVVAALARADRVLENDGDAASLRQALFSALDERFATRLVESDPGPWEA